MIKFQNDFKKIKLKFTNHILCEIVLILIFCFPSKICSVVIIMSLFEALSEVIHPIYYQIRTCRSIISKKTTHLSSNFEMVSNEQKTMSQVFTSMSTRKMMKSNKICPKLKCFVTSSFNLVSCDSHKGSFIWICPGISCK